MKDYLISYYYESYEKPQYRLVRSTSYMEACKKLLKKYPTVTIIENCNL